MNGKEAQEAGTTPPTAGESAEKPSETRHAEQQHIDGDANNGVDLGPPSSTEEDAVRAAEAEAEANGTGPINGSGGDGNSRPKLPRPTGIQPCPRCNSAETKFCYYNNYNIKQPRYYCKGCQRYWTAGGTLRDVPVGAGRRRTKGTRSQDDTLSSGGFSAGSLPSYVDPTLAAVSLAAAAVGKPNGLLVPPMMPPMMPPIIPTVLPALIPPGVIPAMPFSAPVDFSPLASAVGGGGDPLSKVTVNALLTDPAAAAAALGLLHQHHPGALAARTTVTANQKSQVSAASEDGAVEGRRTKRRTGAALNAPPDGPEDKEKDQTAPSNHHQHHNRKNSNNHANSKVTPAGDGGGGGVSGVMPMHIPPYPMDWFAAQHNPQAAVAMQAQMQAAAAVAGYAPPPPYAVPGMWPGYGYGGFPAAGWPNPAAAAAMYQAGATRTSSGMPASSNGGGGGVNGYVHEQAPPAMPWMAPQWPPMAMPLYGMPPGVPMPPGLMPHMPPTAAAAVAVAAAAAAAGAPSMPDINNNKDNSNKAAPGPNDDVN